MSLIPRQTINLITRFEGFRSCPYQDSGGVWTIGYGTTRNVGPDSPCLTKRQARRRLKRHLRKEVIPAVRELVHRPLTKEQFAALYDFTYNVGTANFANSTLRRRLNMNESACTVLREELPRWVYDSARNRQPGLERRRRAEVRIACGG